MEVTLEDYIMAYYVNHPINSFFIGSFLLIIVFAYLLYSDSRRVHLMIRNRSLEKENEGKQILLAKYVEILDKREDDVWDREKSLAELEIAKANVARIALSTQRRRKKSWYNTIGLQNNQQRVSA
ncbi:hypothetical protein L6270_04405 [Candidatus Parcubacteria bacterium]|nr:hypothetical protein [Patescibacteria group bacterium]MBU4309204.1 hypothetical protein [Patescibacteria group bacterium]MBU4432632.1 hypothetical protein [Patescibacteria group bacterium]MBU4577565.1 hypothetical protein [Patescibacteria group bacterium]MCG2697252.1 hypothetical protein [Candidatus Parcubacteria bacterium]